MKRGGGRGGEMESQAWTAAAIGGEERRSAACNV